MGLLKTVSCSLAVTAALAFAPYAGAATIGQITGISGTWTATTPTSGVTTSLGGSQISWGSPASGSGQSSYVFGASTTPIDVESDTTFELGTFTHNNNPIYSNGTILSDATLTVATTLNLGGSSQPIKSVFNFEHWETPNNASPCANPGADNSMGCADRVTFALNLAQTESFLIDGKEYVVNLTGFLINGSLASEFWTKEGISNSAILQGNIVEKASVVPIPAAAWLFGSALLGFFGIGYRRKLAA